MLSFTTSINYTDIIIHIDISQVLWIVKVLYQHILPINILMPLYEYYCKNARMLPYKCIHATTAEKTHINQIIRCISR